MSGDAWSPVAFWETWHHHPHDTFLFQINPLSVDNVVESAAEDDIGLAHSDYRKSGSFLRVAKALD